MVLGFMCSYDPEKYIDEDEDEDEDEDDRNMETDFASIEKEERRR